MKGYIAKVNLDTDAPEEPALPWSVWLMPIYSLVFPNHCGNL